MNIQTAINEFAKILDVQYAFAKLFREKLYFDDYVDVADAFKSRNKNDIKEILEEESIFYPIIKESLTTASNSKAARSEAALSAWKKHFPKNSFHKDMTLSEARAILAWLVYAFHSKSPVSHEFILLSSRIISSSKFFDKYKGIKLGIWQGSIIYNEETIEPENVGSVTEFLSVLSKNCSDDAAYQYFFRGHPKVNYVLLPYILRRDTDSGEYLLKGQEKRLFNEIQVKCPDDFKGISSHLEKLAIMQHYGLPTRLMDITFNPLVALFFAVRSDDSSTGEVIFMSSDKDAVKWPSSDTASVLASLVTLTENEKVRLLEQILKNPDLKSRFTYSAGPAFSMKPKKKTLSSEPAIDQRIDKKLLGEIRLEKPGFQDSIEMDDMTKMIPVLVNKKNQRIIRQNGGFILFGLTPYQDISSKDEDGDFCIAPCDEFKLEKNGKKLLITVSNKDKIRKELKLLNISEETLFPEIEDVARVIKSE